MSDDFPSLNKKRPAGPHGWIQWKGTDVCMDIYCACGYHSHIDADFLYHVKCPKCGQVYECNGYIELIPLQHEPERTKTSLPGADDPDYDPTSPPSGRNE